MYKYLIVALMMSIFVVSGLNTINNLSPTFDEPIHILAGYSYLKTWNFYINIYDHPPLNEMLGCIPLLFYKLKIPFKTENWEQYLQYPAADDFLYRNVIPADKILKLSRKSILFLSCLTALFVFLWANQLYGFAGGLFSLFLLIFNSNIISHGTLVTTDAGLMLFYFLSIYFFWLWLQYQTKSSMLLVGTFTGLAMASKFSGIILIPTLFFLFYLPPIRKQVRVSNKEYIIQQVIFLCSIFMTILLVYRFSQFSLYIDGIRAIIKNVREYGHITFLIDKYSKTGWIYYFIVVFILKTPISMLVLFVWNYIERKKELLSTNSIVLLLPSLLFILVASFSKKQIGIRYILCIYPLLIVWMGSIIQKLILNKGVSKIIKVTIFSILCLWYIASFYMIHPWHISYFNEIIGNTYNAQRYLSDSNLDWGHGMKELGKYYKEEKLNNIYLSYWGSADPSFYGINYIGRYMGGITNPDQRLQSKEYFYSGSKQIYAISTMIIQSIPFYPDTRAFNWLKKYRPEKILARSIYIYDLSKNPVLNKEFRKFWTR
jgi:hypothetical protein